MSVSLLSALCTTAILLSLPDLGLMRSECSGVLGFPALPDVRSVNLEPLS